MIWHRAPRMVVGRWLREPRVTGITGQLSAFQRINDGVTIGKLAAGGVDQLCATFEELQRLCVDHVLGFRMKRAIQRDHIAHLGQTFQAAVISQIQLFFHGVRQAMAVKLVQLDAERLEQAQHA